MTNIARRKTHHPLRWSLMAMAALALLPAASAGAGTIPADEQQLRALIHKVAETGDTATMDKLLAEGMDINLQDSDGQPALVTATLAQQNGMVRLLLDHKADVESRTNKGMTALHAAAYVGDIDAVKMLLAHGAEVNDQANIARITPLHAAAEENHIEVAQLLVMNGADPKKVEVNGYTAGSRAGWREHWKIVWFLLHSGDSCQSEDLAGQWLRDKCTHIDVTLSN